MDKPRLIEVAFPLKQTSLDSVHEKNVRHGHISTLHIWPARRPLAACRAALIATLLPDPGDDKKRQEILERLAGKIVKVVKKKTRPNGKVVEEVVEETEGGILHWGRESGPDLEYFRQEIKKAYGGRAPKVLDPFAGGGAIPLEAMRLGCETTAIDINPVAWFILKCTLEYPQRLAGQKLPLPQFAAESPEFMEGYFKSTGNLSKKQLEKCLQEVQMEMFPPPDVDLSWHVRAWGWWVLREARKELARFYPTYANYEPLDKNGREWEKKEPRLAPLREDGVPDIDALNVDLDPCHINDRTMPRWVAKPTVAYLWARTVTCKNCRAEVPLLKTRWLCKKANNRVVLTMDPKPDKSGVVFGVHANVRVAGNNVAQRREHDKKVGGGTMSKSGVKCPCCGIIMTMKDVGAEGMAGRLGSTMTAVVVVGEKKKEYRLPTAMELDRVASADDSLLSLFETVPFGVPHEPVPKGGSGASRAFSVDGYGFSEWHQLFTPSQLLCLGQILVKLRAAREVFLESSYPAAWSEAIAAYLAVSLDKLADRQSTICRWDMGYSKVNNTFTRFALPIVWDFCEGNPLSETTGNYLSCVEWVSQVVEHCSKAYVCAPIPTATRTSATQTSIAGDQDLILTDPPYYDAIPYSDLMDFFYVWLRRALHEFSPEFNKAFSEPLAPKWDHGANDGELIDDSSRHGGDKGKSKATYEEGMARVFQACQSVLRSDGRLIVVFAHKHPDAWETLVSAIIRAGFVVDGSWPIQTEMGNRQRALTSGALSSSVWLVCKKRPETARPGWDNVVLQEMRERITERLRAFWDAGIRGPDFVWAATGPAMEAYSKHPVVKKANQSDQLMTVSEFLQHVRRMVVDFVVGRVLTHGEGADAVSGLDDVTTYYLLHRHDFGLEEAPSGACIMYALSCGLSDRALADQYEILSSGRTNGAVADEAEEDIDGWENAEVAREDADAEDGGDAAVDDGDTGGGNTVRLLPWNKRRKKTLGYEAPGGRPVPLIDQIHRMMLLWKAGDVTKVDEYIDQHALRNNTLFHQLLQALIELAGPKDLTGRGGSDPQERSLMESISNHLGIRGTPREADQMDLPALGGRGQRKG